MYGRYTSINITPNDTVEVMFHVSTYLPYTKDDKQQVERKRHIGNDVAMIVFKHGNAPLPADFLTTQFTHVVVVVQPIPLDDQGNRTEDVSLYRVGMFCKRDVPPFEPFIPQPPVFHKDQLREFLLAKLINGERASFFSPDFATKLERTRKQLLTDVLNSFVSDPKKLKL